MLQSFKDAIAMAHFEVIQGRQGVLLQLMFVMLSECFAIGDDPRFHAGCHEEHLIVFRAFWLVHLSHFLRCSHGFSRSSTGSSLSTSRAT